MIFCQVCWLVRRRKQTDYSIMMTKFLLTRMTIMNHYFTILVSRITSMIPQVLFSLGVNYRRQVNALHRHHRHCRLPLRYQVNAMVTSSIQDRSVAKERGLLQKALLE
jgi:hypothetical protein